MQISPLREIANELPFFKPVDDREKLLGVIGALVLRKIILSKASEIMGMERERFLGLLWEMGSGLPLTLNNLEQGSTVDLTPFPFTRKIVLSKSAMLA
jgi:predicted HTH domain antitoxin